MQTPLVSIIIPVFNVEPYIKEAITSCINQSLENIEIIVVDDCGKDKSIQIAENFAKNDKRIKIIHNPHNQKLFQTRINGVLEAKSEIIMFLDGDDYLDKNASKLCYEAMGGGGL